MNKNIKERIEEELKERTGNLDLSLCSLTAIPKEISQMAWLKSLYLQNNHISKLEGLEGLSNLTGLYLHGNQINKLEGLEGLSNLTTLYLSRNQISKLEGLEGLKKLVYLNIRKNPLGTILADQIDFLNQLPALNLGETLIDDLSPFYDIILEGKLLLVEDVSLHYSHQNNLDYIDFHVGKSAYSIKKGIYVKGCHHLDSALIAATHVGQQAVINYLKKPKERLFEARVLVLGEPRAGKTTLRRKLKNVAEEMPSQQESTKAFEVEIEPYKCEIQHNSKKETLTYHLWDFGGQDYYRLLHQLFVTEQSVYIIVTDTDRNKNEEEIEFWLETIQRLGKDVNGKYGPIILFQNPKTNREGSDFINLRKLYPFWQQTESFVINLNALNEADVDNYESAELTNFRKFEEYLYRSFCQLTHVGKEMPLQWIAIKNALEREEKQNLITIQRFAEICRNNGIKQKTERTELLNIFRRLGFLMYYDTSKLKGKVFLSREWVTDALYRVLDDDLVKHNKGWFRLEDAEKIWCEEQYEGQAIELLELMKVFRLCYYNTKSKKYIVPAKLPASPVGLPEWEEANNVRLRLQYDWMPKAIVIQLIVSLHKELVVLKKGEQWIWRKGAVLDGRHWGLNEVQVRIVDNWSDRTIEIDARGDHSEHLIRTVMKNWREIHEPFADRVEVTPIILCACSRCQNHKRPFEFEYEDVLNAKKHNDKLKCNKSRQEFEAAAILKGIFDEVTVIVDSHQGHEEIKKLVKDGNLKAALNKLPKNRFTDQTEQRFSALTNKINLGLLSFEQENQERNAIAVAIINCLFYTETGVLDSAEQPVGLRR